MIRPVLCGLAALSLLAPASAALAQAHGSLTPQHGSSAPPPPPPPAPPHHGKMRHKHAPKPPRHHHHPMAPASASR